MVLGVTVTVPVVMEVAVTLGVLLVVGRNGDRRYDRSIGGRRGGRVSVAVEIGVGVPPPPVVMMPFETRISCSPVRASFHAT